MLCSKIHLISSGESEVSLRIQVTNAYIYGLAASAVVSLGGWLYFFGLSFSWTALGAFAALASVCWVSRRFPIEFGRTTVEIADIATLVALVLLGPIWALAIMAPSVFYKDRLRTLFVASGDVVKFLAAGYVLRLFTTPLLPELRFGESFVYGVLVAGLVLYSVDILTNFTLLRLKYDAAFFQTLREEFLPIVPSSVVAILAALGTAYALVVFGPAAALVLFVGTAGALISLYLIHGRQKENEALKAENAGLLSSNVVFAGRLIESLGEKDGYTDRHATASSVYTEDIAKEFGLETERIEKLKVAALLQNVGMIGVPDEVLLTPPAKLNSVGRANLESHAAQGERILSSVPEFEEAAKWVRWHHERPDGTGYPDRLRKEWIPLEAKVLAVSETYASLVLDSPHSPGLSLHDARRQLVSMSGQRLDREVTRTFLRVLDSRDSNYAAAIDDRFSFPTSIKKKFASQ